MPATPLTPEQIAQRLPLWCAFADLFLDTDVSRSYSYIRQTMQASDFTNDELWYILSKEVTPAFWFNMNLVAGQWAGWDYEFVREQVTQRLNQPAWLRSLRRVMACRCQIYVTAQWKNLLAAPGD